MPATADRVAKVIAEIPSERVLTFERNGQLPKIGEVGEFDQIYTAASGETMYCVYHLDSGGREMWSADLLESEFAVIPRSTGDT